MSRGKRAGMLVGGVIAAVAVVSVLFLGFVGIGQEVTPGTQTRVCGTQIGVSVSAEAGQTPTVRLLGTDSGNLAQGDRARLSPVCVVEVVSIGADSGDSLDTVDGGGAPVQLRWRLW